MDENNKNKPIILLGAGAVLEIGAPSTRFITDSLAKPHKFGYYCSPAISKEKAYYTAFEKIFHCLKGKYPGEPNFEHVIHVLEMLYSYKWAWKRENINPDIFPVFAPFVKIVPNVIPDDEWNNLSSLVDCCKNDIMEMINSYDEKFMKNSCNRWYKEFWNKFNGFNLFNLNYDTTIEQSLPSYCDGFVDCVDEECQKFDPRVLFDAEDRYKICHLHGCIVYCTRRNNLNKNIFEDKAVDALKWQNYKIVKEMLKNALGSGVSTQSGESFSSGPIITGLRKTDKIIAAPYNFYNHYFGKVILESNSLLIAGYSFGDLYINDLLERMNSLYGKNKKIVVITKWSCEDKINWDPSDVCDKELSFIGRMMCLNIVRPQDFDKFVQNNEPFTTEDGCVKLFFNGFRNAVEKYGEEIVDFLQN